MSSIYIYAYNVSTGYDELTQSDDAFQDIVLKYPSLYFMDVSTNGTAKNITVGENCIIRNIAGVIDGANVTGSLVAVNGQTSNVILKAKSNASILPTASVNNLTLEENAHAQLYGCTVKNVTASSKGELNVYNDTTINGLTLGKDVSLNLLMNASLTIKGSVNGTLSVKGGTLIIDDDAELSQSVLEITMDSLTAGPVFISKNNKKVSLDIKLPYTDLYHGDFILAEGSSENYDALNFRLIDKDTGETVAAFEAGKTLMTTSNNDAALAVRDTPCGICFSVTDAMDIYITTVADDYFMLENYAIGVDLFNAPTTLNGVYATLKGVNTFINETGSTSFNFSTGEAKRVETTANGKADVVCVTAIDKWSANFSAFNTLTGDCVNLYDKNRFGDVIIASGDKCAIILTNSDDAFFADDIYTVFPDGTVQARFTNINDIYAGAGDDIIDITCCNVEEINKSISIHGGEGNDILWGGNYDVTLYGNAGNDILFGGNGNDILCGGEGDNTLCGLDGYNKYLFESGWKNDTILLQDEENFTLEFGHGITAEMLNITYADNTAMISCADASIFIQNIAPDSLDDRIIMADAA